MAKASNGEIGRRIFSVYGLLMRGEGRPNILRHCATKWKIHEGQADEYISRAHDLMDKVNEANAPLIKQKNLNIRYKLLKLALEKKKDQKPRLDLALQIIEDIDKLSGNYPAEKTDATLRMKPLRYMSLTMSHAGGKKLPPVLEKAIHKNGSASGNGNGNGNGNGAHPEEVD